MNIQEEKENLLNRLVEHLHIENLKLNAPTDDGRVNSALNENEVIESLENLFKTNELLVKSAFHLIIPKTREWFDIAIENKEKNIFLPINIKVSNCKSADNLNCKLGIFYALTGKEPIEPSINLENNAPFKSYISKLKENILTRTKDVQEKDYYFLIVNKTDTADVFWTSLKSLNVLTANGNNLPFQACWNKNRKRIERTQDQAQKFILDKFKESLSLRKEAYVLMEDTFSTSEDVTNKLKSILSKYDEETLKDGIKSLSNEDKLFLKKLISE